MAKLPIWFALHGSAVLGISFVAGLLLHRAIRLGTGDVAAWHLAHAGGSGRGVLLIALASVLRWVALPQSLLLAFVWLMLFFVWTSTVAMVMAAATGKGLSSTSSFMLCTSSGRWRSSRQQRSSLWDCSDRWND